jgi:hypothetical protein
MSGCWIGSDRLGLLPGRRCGMRAPARHSITLDIDATLVSAHSEKEPAAGTYKRRYGFDPICCSLDETGESLADPQARERRIQHGC